MLEIRRLHGYWLQALRTFRNTGENCYVGSHTCCRKERRLWTCRHSSSVSANHDTKVRIARASLQVCERESRSQRLIAPSEVNCPLVKCPIHVVEIKPGSHGLLFPKKITTYRLGYQYTRASTRAEHTSLGILMKEAKRRSLTLRKRARTVTIHSDHSILQHIMRCQNHRSPMSILQVYASLSLSTVL